MTTADRPFATLTLADAARYPRPGTTAPHRLEFTPDGAAITYLFSAPESLVQQLWRYDLATGEQQSLTNEQPEQAGSFSIEEQLRRERSRTREVGVTDYQFVREDGAGQLVLLVPRSDALYQRRGDGPLTEIPGTAGALDPTLSPNGRHVAFVRNDELWVTDLTTAEAVPRQLTSSAGDGITNGVAEYIAQEEMGRSKGYWWSPNSQHLAYVQADSRHIPRYPIVHQGSGSLIIEEHRYPFTGQPNARVRLGILTLDQSTAPYWLDLGANDDIYLARVAWRPDAVLTAQIESRDQRTLRLVAFDTAGQQQTLIEEHGDPWLNLANDLRFLPTGEFIWSHERSGFRHLALYQADGQEIRALTAGEWLVTGVVAVDNNQRTVYFHGTRDGVTERHLYRVSLDGGEITKITTAAGWHETVVAPTVGLYVDRYSALANAPTLTIRRLADNTVVATLFADPQATAEKLGLPVPELASFQTADGATLQAAIYSPAAATNATAYPIIVSVYGGPHAQRVENSWNLTVDLRAQYLAQQGFVVLKVDNRGSANRGLAFEGAIAGDMGKIEVADQVAGVEWLAANRPYADGKRVGIYGSSYGGYMTCMALFQAPATFKVGVSGAPVTHWDGYDTYYTERYMGHPAQNPSGYRNSAPLTHVEKLQGKLLLIHGLIDENVHFRHTARLITALIAADKDYDLLIFPSERHMPRDAKGLEYYEKRLVAYFQQYL